jgi:hypothetical protein
MAGDNDMTDFQQTKMSSIWTDSFFVSHRLSPPTLTMESALGDLQKMVYK